MWIDRYYRRDVAGAGEMHSVLRYVFGNAKKHGLLPRDAVVLDGCSTAWTFDGWDVAHAAAEECLATGRGRRRERGS